jgi:hypothetical protein
VHHASDILNEEIKEKQDEPMATQVGAWVGAIPFLCLIYCVIDDSILHPHYFDNLNSDQMCHSNEEESF